MTAADQKRVLAARYRIDGSLGRGGMSEVFHGYDERLNRRVAIKILRQTATGLPDSPEASEIEDAQERDRKRFLREISTTAQLEHPGTPAVYDTGEEIRPDGSTEIWLVMQLLRGSTLEATLDRTTYSTAPPSVKWAIAIVTQLAAVLAGVHRVDVVHRDIKPANVMIIDGGLVKVLDFGIAILRGAGALPRLTQVDRTVGTPAYMSPEQCLGRPVTSASDIYSLGCLLFELLTGDTPFNGTPDTPLRNHHLYSPAPSARTRRPEVPETVDELVSSMLAKDPQDRPTAEAVYLKLLPLASSDAVLPDGEDHSRDPTLPFRQPLLATPQRRRRAESLRTLTHAEAALLRSNVNAFIADDQLTEAIHMLEYGVDRASHDPTMELQLRQLLGAALFYACEYTRSASVFDSVGNDFRMSRPPNDPYVLDASYYAGHAYAEIGKPKKALGHLRFYVKNADASDSQDEAIKILESRFLIAQMLATAGDTGDALSELEAIRPLLADAFGAESTQVRNLDKQIDRLRSASR
ncbi:MAG TPA: serine/threonine-protein kinase [Streptosporangiaceae bacterium]|nr:serine/threonine-protein kinase [Streptosporangiaceae bacterium]